MSPGEIVQTVFLCHRKAAIVAGDEPGGSACTRSLHTHTHSHTHTHMHTHTRAAQRRLLLSHCDIKGMFDLIVRPRR